MNKSIRSFVFSLAPFMFAFAIAMDLYVPALPEMTQAFHTTHFMVQMTLSLFMMVLGFGQLIMGPLTDQWGRRRIAIISALIFLLSSLLCLFAPNINVLIIGRMLQAFGACGMMVVAFAITRDVFSGDDSARVYSLLNCMIGLSPIIAPILGSYMAVWWGWHAAFWTLSAFGIIALMIAVFKVDETLPHHKRIKINLALFARYWKIVTHKVYFIYAYTAFSAMGLFFTWFSISPYLTRALGIPTEDYGYYFFVAGAAFFIGSYISSAAIKKYGVLNTALIGCMLMLGSMIAMAIGYFTVGMTILNYIIPMGVAGLGGALMMGAGAGGAMEPFPEFAGTAAAVLGFFQFFVSGLIASFAVGYGVFSTLTIFITGFIVCGPACLVILIMWIKSKSRRY